MNKVKFLVKFKFCISKECIVALMLGVLSVLLSLFLNSVKEDMIRFLLRSCFQMAIVGVLMPTVILYKDNDFDRAGLRLSSILKYILISTVLAILLLSFFIKESGGNVNHLFTVGYIQPTIYIMLANVFEVIFFAGFLRYYFEESFGIIPAIVLAALFYSLHHAGFQPEFIKLFWVGIFFISIYRMANNWLVCFPLWWVGGLGDVLVSSSDKINTHNMTILNILPVAMAIVVFCIALIKNKKMNKVENNCKKIKSSED